MFDLLQENERLRREVIAEQVCVGGNEALARLIDERGELLSLASGSVLIEQGAETNDVFFILAGVCNVIVSGRTLAKRGSGTHIGEMAAIQPTQLRQA